MKSLSENMMTKNYVLLVNNFYEKLDVLQKDEVYIILGGARKKYAPELSTSHEIVTRQMVKKNTFESFLHAVVKTKALLSVSNDKNTGVLLPEKSHVIYVSINPRSTIKAKTLTDMVMNNYLHSLLQNESKENRMNAYEQFKRFNVHFYSSLQKSPTNNKWRILDIDYKNEKLLKDCIEVLDSKNIKFITETRGGYHIIYDRRANEYLLGKRMASGIDFIRKKYNLAKHDLETFKDRLTPVWGTTQGGFEVKPYLKW